MAGDANLLLGALCYGDHPELAARCLGSVADHVRHTGSPLVAVRLGLNAASPATVAAARKALARFPDAVVQHPDSAVFAPADSYNAGKYPLLKRMLSHPVGPEATHLWWMDDDSYLKPHLGDGLSDWAFHLGGLDLDGATHTCRLRSGQASWVRRQPWYVGRPEVPDEWEDGRWPRSRPMPVRFFTGGFWAARLSGLWEWDYPFRQLHHNGGDYLLGLLAAQQGWRTQFAVKTLPRAAVWNAELTGRHGWEGPPNSSPRRGMTTPAPGQNGWEADAAVHAFACEPVPLGEWLRG